MVREQVYTKQKKRKSIRKIIKVPSSLPARALLPPSPPPTLLPRFETQPTRRPSRVSPRCSPYVIPNPKQGEGVSCQDYCTFKGGKKGSLPRGLSGRGRCHFHAINRGLFCRPKTVSPEGWLPLLSSRKRCHQQPTTLRKHPQGLLLATFLFLAAG